MPLVLGAALATGVLLEEQRRSDLVSDRALRADVAKAAAPVAGSLRQQLQRAAAGPQQGDRTVPAASPSASAIEARDTGAPVLDQQGPTGSIVVPIYRPGSTITTTRERRAAIAGYRITPLVLTPVLKDLVPDGGGLAVRNPSGTVLARTSEPGSHRFEVDLAVVDQPGWRLVGWPRAPGLSTGGWLSALVIMVVALIAAVLMGVDARRRDEEQAEAAQRERDRVLVSGLAPVVQSSLDLGRVVPAVATHLVDGLGLAGLGLSVPGEGGERQLFTWGRAPDGAVPPVHELPEQLPVGGTFAVALTRGGRVLGVLRIVAGAPLGKEDLQALITASELLGSTLANAEAFSRQQVLVEQMRAVDELKTVFLATASHELRTPVTAIAGFTGILLSQWDTLDRDTGRQFLERVSVNAKGLETLISELLDFSRLERGLKPSGTDLLDLSACVRTILDDQPGLYADHQIHVELAPDCRVFGSTSALERIVTNLVGNASKYSPAGTAVTVTVRPDGDRHLLLVDDEGPGVAEADRERVFSRFYRGSGDQVTSTRGAGIGLAVVAEYATSMSAHASVEAAPSGGARFVVSFPAAHELDSEGADFVPLP